MTKSSIHIVPVKQGSEAHNFRLKEFDYVRKDLTHLNESWSTGNIGDRLNNIKSLYTKTVGRRMHAKSTPIREGVCNLSEDTGMKDLHELRISLKNKFGINAFQIHIHRDEGHYKKGDSKNWYPNLHAHIVFDWTDSKTGKSIKLNRHQMSEMQTMVATILKMERGVSSDKKHINAIAFKHQKRIQELQEIISRYNGWNKDLSKLRSEIKDSGEVLVIKDRLGRIDMEKTMKNIESILLENQKLTQRLSNVTDSLKNQTEKSKDQEEKYMKIIMSMDKQIKKNESKLIELFNCPEELRMNKLEEKFPHVHRALNQNRGRGIK